MGILAVSVWLRNLRHTSRPSIPGIITSSRIRSGFVEAANLSASGPLSAVRTSCSVFFVMTIRFISRQVAESSTINIFLGIGLTLFFGHVLEQWTVRPRWGKGGGVQPFGCLPVLLGGLQPTVFCQ